MQKYPPETSLTAPLLPLPVAAVTETGAGAGSLGTGGDGRSSFFSSASFFSRNICLSSPDWGSILVDPIGFLTFLFVDCLGRFLGFFSCRTRSKASCSDPKFPQNEPTALDPALEANISQASDF